MKVQKKPRPASVQDYLIDHAHYDWPNLLIDWTWLLPPNFKVWLMNRFGDLFLELPGESIYFFNVGAGTVTKLAECRDQFYRKMDEGDNASEWLMVTPVDRLVAAGVRLRPGFCYSFGVLPVLGGQPAPDNTLILGIAEHYRRCATVHSKSARIASVNEV